jgi:hypothetical protein
MEHQLADHKLPKPDEAMIENRRSKSLSGQVRNLLL